MNAQTVPPPRVRRITVDERLGSSSVRLLIADLEKIDEVFRVDDLTLWGEEKEQYVSRRNFLKVLGVDKKDISLKHAMKEIIGEVGEVPTHDILWRSLTEGQVFLNGNFCKKHDKDAHLQLDIHDGTECGFLRIDRMYEFKEINKQLYTRAVCGREE